MSSRHMARREPLGACPWYRSKLMSDRPIIVMGLPASGKTTYLAALWHVLTSDEVPSLLKLAALGRGSMKYLNEIAARWRDAQKQERTLFQGTQLVEINLKRDGDDADTRVTFPDETGEDIKWVGSSVGEEWGSQGTSRAW